MFDGSRHAAGSIVLMQDASDAAAARSEAGRRGDTPLQLRMKPSSSPSAQASVFSMASPW